MREKKAFAQVTADWDQLLAAVEANRADLPEVEAFRVQLEANLEDLRAAYARRASLEAERLQATRAVSASLAHGKALASRIRIWVRGQYGRHSNKLIEFGIKPYRRQGRPRGQPERGERYSPESHRTAR
jgi:hypothetical protein